MYHIPKLLRNVHIHRHKDCASSWKTMHELFYQGSLNINNPSIVWGDKVSTMNAVNN